ncbi:MAG TPA: PilZ domain-containing protein [Candidatus Omnitrophota bacterium]|nr:PilZ domain-containing protein [Candidatus Omnitrophota bacterium]HPS19673.1 PilZ domain-containing protein [Candidatus Omnitrophota bacterium]
MSPFDFSEKRHSARLALKCRISVRIEGKDSGAKNFSAIGKNISTDGILFASKQQLTAGDTILMTLSFPGEETKEDQLLLRGAVKWCSPIFEGTVKTGFYDTGIRFVDLDQANLKFLVKYVCGNLTEGISR